MAPKFGTSGLRGLVTELTVACVTDHVHAFLASCSVGTGLYVGYDLRQSSQGLADAIAHAAQDFGVTVTMCGAVPTPALAQTAMAEGAGAIMVTGSHIPADRNGLKFYTPQGEITKAEEALILAALGSPITSEVQGALRQDDMVNTRYAARYQSAYQDVLQGKHIGLYQHSAVGRDALADLLESLGAQVTVLGRSEVFVPVDTEAISDDLRRQLRVWAQDIKCDAIVSTDADGDRPLLADQNGEVVPGDILGQITAAAIGAARVVTPVSSNTGVDVLGQFEKVTRTAIGSPYVIAGMERSGGRVVGYEANGGFILGFDAQGLHDPLPKLMTRDAVLPILATLAASSRDGIAACVAAQPARFTVAGRLQEIDLRAVAALLDRLRESQTKRDAFLADLASECEHVDETDGLRMTLADARIVHMRPSGNAPEMRMYVEAHSKEIADQTLNALMPLLAAELS